MLGHLEPFRNTIDPAEFDDMCTFVNNTLYGRKTVAGTYIDKFLFILGDPADTTPLIHAIFDASCGIIDEHDTISSLMVYNRKLAFIRCPIGTSPDTYKQSINHKCARNYYLSTSNNLYFERDMHKQKFNNLIVEASVDCEDPVLRWKAIYVHVYPHKEYVLK
jgi:hypothetical protein